MSFRTIEISDPQFEFNGIRMITVKSNALKARADVSVYIPEAAKGKKGIAVIVLLHGVFGSHWAWLLKGGVHQTLERMITNGESKPFILVMPSDGLWGDGSGYVPHQIQDFEKWIGEDIPRLAKEVIEEVNESSTFFIAGLSMGGYGAFRVGLNYPIYQGVSGHSSVIDIRKLIDFVEEDWSFWKVENEENTILDTIQKNHANLVPFRFDCGLEDELVHQNQQLHKDLLDANIHHQFETFSGGHNWPYWQKNIEKTLSFFTKIS
jgi:enterochelin esterase-like enzyme